MSGEDRWCVVTGGRGFAARHLVEMLLKQETYSVRIADLGPKIELEPYEEGILGEALQSGRAKYVPTDLRDKAQVVKGVSLCQPNLHISLALSILIRNTRYSPSTDGLDTEVIVSYPIDMFSVLQLLKELRLSSTWLLLIPPLITTNFIIL